MGLRTVAVSVCALLLVAASLVVIFHVLGGGFSFGME
jgi:hypothetical protein